MVESLIGVQKLAHVVGVVFFSGEARHAPARIASSGSAFEPASEGPPKGMGFVLVPVANKALDDADEFGGRWEGAVFEDAASQKAEPDLHLVHPRRVQRRVEEAESSSVALVEGVPRGTPMNIEIVPDDGEVAGRVPSRDAPHKAHQVVGLALNGALADDLPGMGIEGGKKRPCAVTTIFELAAPRLAACGRLERVLVLESLHPRLFIDAKHHVTGSRFRQVDVADSADLRPKVGVGAMQPETYMVRTNLLHGEDAPNLGLAQQKAAYAEQRGTQRICRPHVSKRELALEGAITGELDQLEPNERRHRGRPT